MKIFAIALALATLPISAAIADDLDDGAAICEKHVRRNDTQNFPRSPRLQVIHEEGHVGMWDHCIAIIEKHDARVRDAAAADEKTNPDLKKTRDLARQLSGK